MGREDAGLGVAGETRRRACLRDNEPNRTDPARGFRIDVESPRWQANGSYGRNADQTIKGRTQRRLWRFWPILALITMITGCPTARLELAKQPDELCRVYDVIATPFDESLAVPKQSRSTSPRRLCASASWR